MSSARLPLSDAACRTMRARRLHVALKGHHARAHQTVLQLRDRAGLLGEKILCFLGQRLQELLDARDIARGLGQRARNCWIEE